MTGNMPYDLCIEFFKCSAERQLNDVYAQKQLVARIPHLIRQMENNLKFLDDYLQKVTLQPTDIITCTLIREINDNIESADDAIKSFDLANKSKSLFSAFIPDSELVESAELVQSLYEEVNTTRNKVEKHIYKLSRYEHANKTNRHYSDDGATQEYEKACRNCEDIPIIPPITSEGARKRKRGASEDDLMSTMKKIMANAFTDHIGKSNDQMAKFVRSSAEVDNQKKDNRHMLNEELKKVKSLTKSARQKAALKLIRNLDLLDYFFTLDDDDDKKAFIEELLSEN